jgi:Putative zinc-finger
VDRMTPPEEHRRCWEQIGAFLLGKLDGGERTAMQTHLDSCPVCQAEVRELEPVVTALADATLGRIEEPPEPPKDLEEQTLAPILGEIHRARRRRRPFRWSAMAAAAICVVAVGLAGFVGLLEPAVALVEPVPFSVAPGTEVEGHLIEHARGTEIRLVVSGSRDGQTHRVTLVSEDGERVNAGTFIGIGDKPLRGTFNAALLREDAVRLEVRTPGGELVFFANLPEETRDKVRDWPLFGILPWADPVLQNKIMGSGGPESPEGPTQEESKDFSSGGGASSASPDPDAAPGAGGQESVPPDAGQDSVPPDAGQESASPAAGKQAVPASASPAADQY